MATAESVKAKISTLINFANAVTGGVGTNLTDAVAELAAGYSGGGGAAGGSIFITENGTHDIKAYSTAVVTVTGLNARIFTAELSADQTSGNAVILTDDWLKTIREDPGGFVLMRYLGIQPATAMLSFWLTANFSLCYNGETAYNSLLLRTTESYTNLHLNVNGLPGTNYSGHLNIDADGNLWLACNETYPLRSGSYQIIAGTAEML